MEVKDVCFGRENSQNEGNILLSFFRFAQGTSSLTYLSICETKYSILISNDEQKINNQKLPFVLAVLLRVISIFAKIIWKFYEAI